MISTTSCRRTFCL